MDLKSFFITVMIFAMLNLIFTLVGVAIATPGEAIGGLRAVNSILPKLLQLVSVGLVVGISSIVVLRKFNLELALSGIILTPLLDIDHLPTIFGVPQPIRPAHSFLFMIVVSLTVYMALKRVDLSLMTISASMVHLGADTSLFPLLSPLTLELYAMDELGHVGLFAVAVGTAILAGYAASRAEKSAAKRLMNASNTPKVRLDL